MAGPRVDPALNPEARHLVAMMRAALHRQAAPPVPPGLDWRGLYACAMRQGVMPMVYDRLPWDAMPDPALAEEFRQAGSKAVAKEAIQEVETSLLLAAFEASGIRHMPLKGCLLKRFYPAEGMRGSCDVDILYNAGDARKVRKIMAECGFTGKVEEGGDWNGVGNVDTYYKLPVMNVEMHRELFPAGHEYAGLFADVWSRAALCENRRYEYRMCGEDVRLYLIVHTAKHFASGNADLRATADIHVLQSAAAAADREYVERMLTRLGLRDFAANLEAAAGYLFGRGECDEAAAVVIGQLFQPEDEADRRKRRFASYLGHVGRLRHILIRLFPGAEELAPGYPCLNARPRLLPLIRIIRLGRLAVCRPGIFLNKTVTLFRILSADLRESRKIMKNSGLNNPRTRR